MGRYWKHCSSVKVTSKHCIAQSQRKESKTCILYKSDNNADAENTNFSPKSKWFIGSTAFSKRFRQTVRKRPSLARGSWSKIRILKPSPTILAWITSRKQQLWHSNQPSSLKGKGVITSDFLLWNEHEPHCNLTSISFIILLLLPRGSTLFL